MTEELNQGLPRTTPASGQSGIWTRGDRIDITGQRPKPFGQPASYNDGVVRDLISARFCHFKVTFVNLLYLNSLSKTW